jgi:hypothetical protein
LSYWEEYLTVHHVAGIPIATSQQKSYARKRRRRLGERPQFNVMFIRLGQERICLFQAEHSRLQGSFAPEQPGTFIEWQPVAPHGFNISHQQRKSKIATYPFYEGSRLLPGNATQVEEYVGVSRVPAEVGTHERSCAPKKVVIGGLNRLFVAGKAKPRNSFQPGVN